MLHRKLDDRNGSAPEWPNFPFPLISCLSGCDAVADVAVGPRVYWMMSGDYKKDLRALRSSIDAAEGGPFSIGPELAVLLRSGQGEPSLARDLLLSLSDDAHSGSMFALVHAAEGLQPNTHTSTVLSLLPELVANSPNWALQLLRRIMNGDATFEDLIKQVEALPAPIKAAVRMLSVLNDEISPDYLPQGAKARLALAAS
jgi:hypothetical protein